MVYSSQARARAGAGARTGNVQRDVLARRLAHNAHPHQLLRSCGSSGAWNRGPRLILRPAHGPLGCGSSGSGVLLALLARLPLGLHVALDLSPINLRRWALFGHPIHAEVEEAPLPRRPVGLGDCRPFPNGFTGPSSSFCGSEYPLLLARINYLGVKLFGALR